MSTSSLRNRIQLVLLAVVLVGSGLRAYQLALATAKPRDAEVPSGDFVVNGLAVSAVSLDMDVVWEDKDVPWQLPIRNRTANTVHIKDFVVSCGCVTIEPRSLSIAAGETATLQLRFDVTHRAPVEIGLDRRQFHQELRPVFRDIGVSRSGWLMRGIVRSRVTLDTAFVQFGEEPVQDQPPASRKLVATVHVPAERLEATVDPPMATVEVIRRTSSPARFDLSVTPQPALPPGSFQGNLVLNLRSAGGERLPGLTVPVAGNVQPAVRALPARLLLGSKPLGQVAEATVVLQAPATSEYVVDHIETDSPDVHVEPVRVEGAPPGRAFRVTQQVTKEGDQTSTVRFVIRKSGRVPVPLTMDVCYRGEATNRPVEQGTRKQP